MSRKYEAIDLVKLYSKGSNNGWNKVLDECFLRSDINRLAKLRYGIQAGMDDLAKQGLNKEAIVIFFIRLNRSIENTAKQIIRKRHPLPQDNPLIADKHDPKYLDAKRKRDRELAVFFKTSAY